MTVGDQYFWADRVEVLGVGSSVRKLNKDHLTAALKTATQDIKQIDKAKLLGEEIRAEDGVGNAIQSIYRDLVRRPRSVRSLTCRPQGADDQSVLSPPPSPLSHVLQEYAKSLIKHPDDVASSAPSSPSSSPSTSVRELPSATAAAGEPQDGDASVVRSTPVERSAKDGSPGRAGDSDESWDVVPEGKHADASTEQGTSGKHKHGGLGLVGTVIGGLTGGLTNGLGNKAKEKR